MATELEQFAAESSLPARVSNRTPVVWSRQGEEFRGRVVHGGFNRAATMSTGGSGPSVVRALAKPFHPLFSSPDRLQLPVQLAQMNQYWRLYYNMDPIIGGAIDMQAEMPWSGAELSIEDPGGQSKEIVHAYEDMLNETDLLSWLPKLTREYYVIGEVFPYAFWNDDDGIFDHITLYNPDYMEVVDSPLVADEPILTLRPSADMKRLMQSNDPRYVKLRQKVPPEILNMLAAGRNIPLDPIQISHVARKAFPYDIRGVSILARLFRILMYEDAVFQGQIQQAQRHALPLRVFKIGDQQRGWIPGKGELEEFIQMLAEAENDPLAAITYHYGLQVEYHGMEGKQLKLTQEWDIIERAKLIALGVNKAFIHGEVTYASANAGLQVLMMRCRALRDMVMSDWVYKKLFAVMADLRGFTRTIRKSDDAEPETRNPAMDRKTEVVRDQLRKIAELKDPNEQIREITALQGALTEVNQHSYKVEIAMQKHGGTMRSKVNRSKKLLYPKLQFQKRLDVRQDDNVLRMWADMVEKGYVSPRSLVQGAGLDFDTEMASIAKDAGQVAKAKILMSVLEQGSKAPGGLAGATGIGSGLVSGEGDASALEGEGGEAGEGAGAPGSAGGDTGPAAAASTKRQRRVLGKLPPAIRADIRAIERESDAQSTRLLQQRT